MFDRVAKLTHYTLPTRYTYQLKSTFTYKASTLSYQRIGHGPQHFLGFHGFGSSAQDLTPVKNILSEQQSVWLFDLFHHGESLYTVENLEKNILQPEDLSELFTVFTDQKGIRNFGLLGFSLGGKICLSLLGSLPNKVTRCVLFAPDGITIHPVYKFTSRSKLGRTAYKWIIDHPTPLLLIVRIASWLRLLHVRTADIVLFNMGTKEKRQLLYDVWLTYRDLTPDLEKINAQCIRSGTHTRIYLGKYDHVIPANLAKELQRKFPEAETHVLESGHLDLVSRAVRMHPEMLDTKKGA